MDSKASSLSVQLNLIPEFSLAVAACGWPPSAVTSARTLAALTQKIDWRHFLRVVSRHRVAGLVHHRFSESQIQPHIPADVLASLRESVSRYARDALLAATQTIRLTKALELEGIAAAILKGAPLAVQAYGNLSIRHCKDIDIIVAHEDALRAHDVLQSLGYLRHVPALNAGREDIAFFMRHRFHFEYVATRSGQQVELHWRSGNSPELGPCEYASHRWSQVSLGGGMQVRALAGEDLLAYLCLHGAKHAWYRLKWLADVAALLAQDPEASSRLLQVAGAQGSAMPAMQALSLCHCLWDQPLPPEMARPSWRVRALTHAAFTAMTAQKAAAEINEESFASSRISLSHLLLSSSPRFWRRELVNMIMPLDAWEEPSFRKRMMRLLARPPKWVARKLQRHSGNSTKRLAEGSRSSSE